jgi:hypothetical protein
MLALLEFDLTRRWEVLFTPLPGQMEKRLQSIAEPLSKIVYDTTLQGVL